MFSDSFQSVLLLVLPFHSLAMPPRRAGLDAARVAEKQSQPNINVREHFMTSGMNATPNANLGFSKGAVSAIFCHIPCSIQICYKAPPLKNLERCLWGDLERGDCCQPESPRDRDLTARNDSQVL